jgi:alpha-1,2-mannosyltransferase
LITHGSGTRGGRILAIGTVAFLLVLAGWAVYEGRHGSAWTLYPADLYVYRDGGLIIRHIRPTYDPKLAHPLYDWARNTTQQFTYTPFAAIAFAVVSVVPRQLDGRLEEAVNILALAGACWATMRGLGYTRGRTLLGGALLGAAAGMLTEPVFRTVYLGQINIVLMLAIIWDLTQPDTPASRRWKGVATGVAAGVKLVPLIFIPYLLLTRRFRQAFLALAGFLGTVAAGFLVAPGDSSDYWLNGLFFDGGRTGFVGWGGNQSLRGLCTRLAGSIHGGTLPWLVAAVAVAVTGLLAAAVLTSDGHQMPGLLTVALVGLLDSPVSWDHHWVWVVPGMMAAAHYAVAARRSGSPVPRQARWPSPGCACVVAVTLLVFAPWPGSLWSVKTYSPGTFTWGLIWAAPDSRVYYFMDYGDLPRYREYHWHGLQVLAGNAFVLAGLAALGVLVVAAVRVRLATRARRTAAVRDAATPKASGVVVVL